MTYQRLLNKEEKPSDKNIITHIGKKANLWLEIHKYIEKNYDFTSELIMWIKKYGWTIRYKKGKKNFVYFFPEKEAFSILIVLGQKEANSVDLNKLSKNVKTIFENTEQLRDGRWLWVRVLNKADLESLKILLNAKKKPKKIPS